MPNVDDYDLAGLEAERERVREQLVEVGDLRRGSVNDTYRRCGKPRCICAESDHPGHGPMHVLTKSVGGKTVTRAIAQTELKKVQQEVGEYKRFRTIVDDFIEVNERICEVRPLPDAGSAEAVGDGKKRALVTHSWAP